MDNPLPETPTTSANRQIARAAGTVMLAFVVSNLVGLVAKMLTARAFGTSMENEALFAANRFSDILFNLVAGGALASAFIPTFTTVLTRGERPAAWRLASAVTNIVVLILTAFAVLSFIFAPEIVRYILAPGFVEPEKQQLTVELLRIMLPSSIIFGISGLLMGVLNSHQRFLISALAPAMYQLGWIIGALLLVPLWGVRGLALGTVIGAGLHLLIQVPTLLRLPERRYFATLGLHIPQVREVARLMAPRLLGVAVVQLNFWLNTFLASQQPEGSVSAISFAFALMLVVQIAIAQSIAIAALPTFSAQVARGRKDEMRSSLAAVLRTVLLLSIPATLGLILLRDPLIGLVYRGGEFTAQSASLVSWALLWYAAGLVGHSVVEVVSRAFYALHDTKTPVMVGVAAMSLNLIFSLLFSAVFVQLGWAPHGGLALANSLATALECIVLLILMRRRLEGLHSQSILRAALIAAAGTLLMSLALAGWLALAVGQSSLLLALGGIGIGGVTYAAVLLVLRPREVQAAIGFIRHKFHR
jgi:putative peptidoglycan lipid II flippase